ncbi:hypothetical protein DXG01_010229 [Tephrocybe rancida]|nr:hypothetical protein DXG01_010229 [Tephrocybe rancida]
MSIDTNPAILHRIEFQAGSSNVIILNAEEATLAKFLLKELSGMETTISAERIALEADMDRVRSRIQRLTIAIAPHKKVPVQVLCRIFRDASCMAWTRSGDFNSFSPKSNYGPWNLRQICSRWRKAALFEPFWCCLALLPKTDVDRSRVRFWAQNIAQLSHPLSLNLQNIKGEEIVHDELILPYHKQISDLKINITKMFLGLPPNFFPSLKRLTVFPGRWLGQYDMFVESACFSGMNSLRTLTIHVNVPYPITTVPSTIPWSQLTDLTLRPYFKQFTQTQHLITTPFALTLLQRCPNLKRCKLKLIMRAVDKPTTPIHHPTLRCLSLTEKLDASPDAQQQQEMSLLAHLVAPSLVTLKSEFLSQGYPVDLIGSFITRSGCVLRSLFIESDQRRVPFDLSTSFLDQLSSLHQLEAKCFRFPDATIERIVNGDVLPNILPLSLAADGEASICLLTQLVERRSAQYIDLIPANLTSPMMMCITVCVENSSTPCPEEVLVGCLQRVKACQGFMKVKISGTTLATWDTYKG